MEVLKYEVEVIKWEESPWESYADLSANMSFGLDLSPPDVEDSQYSYFIIRPKMEIINGGNHAVFIGETKSAVRLTNNGVPPTPQILFEIIEDAARDFGKMFLEKTGHNPHINHNIPRPLFKNLKAGIDDCLVRAYPSNFENK